MTTTRSVAPSDLLIDEHNPRLSEPNVGQNKALETLARQLDRKLATLAGDIVKHGLDPSSLMIVMPALNTPARYVVLEGNRRLTALRVLEDPESIAAGVTVSTLRLLRRLSRQYRVEPIEAVGCVVVPDRETARHWIEIRHTARNLGAGPMSWNSHETDLFQRRNHKTVAAVAIDTRSDNLLRGGIDAQRHGLPAWAESLRIARANDQEARPLSKREIEVIGLVLEGSRNKDIADRLSISQETVRVHLRTIFAKLGVHDRTAAVKVALRHGIVHLR